MGLTNFPFGVNIGSAAGVTAPWSIGGTVVNAVAADLNNLAGAGGAALAYTAAGKKVAAGTVGVPTGAAGTAFASGLTTVDYVLASIYGQFGGTAFSEVSATKSGGSVTLYGFSILGVASTVAGTATWVAVGS